MIFSCIPLRNNPIVFLSDLLYFTNLYRHSLLKITSRNYSRHRKWQWFENPRMRFKIKDVNRIAESESNLDLNDKGLISEIFWFYQLLENAYDDKIAMILLTLSKIFKIVFVQRVWNIKILREWSVIRVFSVMCLGNIFGNLYTIITSLSSLISECGKMKISPRVALYNANQDQIRNQRSRLQRNIYNIINNIK